MVSSNEFFVELDLLRVPFGLHQFENSTYSSLHLDWAASIVPFDWIFVTVFGYFLWSSHIYRFYIAKRYIQKKCTISRRTFLSAEHLANAARNSFGSGLPNVLWIGSGLDVSDGINFDLSNPGSSEIKLDVFEFVDSDDFVRVFYIY